MSWVAAGVAGGAIVGGMIQGNAAKKAAGIQGDAAAAATAENARQYDISREDMAPWRESGKSALSRLDHLMGLPGYETAGQAPKTLEAIAQELRDSGRFTNPKPPGTTRGVFANPALSSWESNPFNEEAVMAEAQKMYAAQRQGGATSPGGDFGSLQRRFTLNDFDNDPVIQKSLQFGLDEGNKALSRMKRAQGTFNSGGTAKALSRYTTDYVGQQAGASRDRFVQDQTNVYNRLAGVAGTGQTAAQNTAQLGAQTATNNANLTVGAANARGAASIAQGNAFSNAFNQGGNAIQRQYMMNQMFPQQQTSPSYVSDDYRWGE